LVFEDVGYVMMSEARNGLNARFGAKCPRDKYVFRFREDWNILGYDSDVMGFW
jgi:hypothetical protein